MAESLSPILEQPLQETGSNPNTWGEVLNAVIVAMEKAIAGYADVDVTNGDVTLSMVQALPRTLYIIGAPAADVVVTLPAKSKDWTVVDLTFGGKKITLRTGSDATGITLPKASTSSVNSRGGKLYGGLGRVDGTGGGLGSAVNNNVTVINTATGGTIGTGGVITLTEDQASSGILVLKGAQAQDLILKVPSKKARWSIVNLLTNPQPAPGQGGAAPIGTVTNGTIVGKNRFTPQYSAEARAAFGVTIDAGGVATPNDGTIIYADIVGLLSTGSFQGAAAYTNVPTGTSTYNDGFRQQAIGDIYEGGGANGTTYKGGYGIYIHQDGSKWLFGSERGGATMRMKMP